MNKEAIRPGSHDVERTPCGWIIKRYLFTDLGGVPQFRELVEQPAFTTRELALRRAEFLSELAITPPFELDPDTMRSGQEEAA